jgi:hypothetical protein
MIMRMKTGILQPIIKKVLVILPFYLFTFLPLTAQTFTQNIQKTKTGEGTITIHQDTAIDELVNGPVPTVKQKPTIKKTTPVKPTSRDNKKDTHVTQEIKDTIESLQEIDSLNNTPKRTFKAIGYRVQVLAGGNTRQDRQRAEQAGRSLRSLFPGEEVYVHFYSPRWICRLGNYRTYDEAHEKLLEVRKMGYEAATIVKGKITLTEEIK